MRGKQLVALALIALGLTTVLTGCTQSCLRQECDWASAYRNGGIPLSLEIETADAIVPVIPEAADPATVADPERSARFISLPEALALGLENGTTGLQSIRNPGLVSDDLVSFAGRAVVGSDSIRVLALDPAIAGAGVDAALARFDAIWSNSISWRQTDQPTQGLSSFQNGSGATFSSTLAKPLPTGGVAGITFSTDYSLLSSPPTGAFSVINPTYQPRLQFGIEQPLLRGAGTEVNQVLDQFPGSNLFRGFNRVTSLEGILITRLRFDQQRADFERSIHFLVLNVEAAYWNLYGAYFNLYSAEQGLRQSHAAWNIGKAQFEGGKIDNSQFALLRAQYEQFRAARMTALGTVLNNERTLRILLGLPVEDGQRLVPADAPTLTPYQPNWQASLRDCLTLRPELILARQELQAKHLQLTAEKNSLLPDVRFQATYGITGLGSELEGNGRIPRADGSTVTSNALRSLSNNQFNDWTIGLNANVPLGYRAEHAATRQARLSLAQSYQLLKEQERRSQTVLAKQYSLVIETYKLIEIRKLAREALADQLESRFRKYVAGAKDSTLEFLLDAQRQWALALSDEYQAVVNYNIALASFEFARGTILDRNNVTIAEGPLPACAQVRAVEHQRECTYSHVIRERAHPVIHPPYEAAEPGLALPQLPMGRAPTMPALMAGTPPAPLELESRPASRPAPAASKAPTQAKATVTNQEPELLQPIAAQTVAKPSGVKPSAVKQSAIQESTVREISVKQPPQPKPLFQKAPPSAPKAMNAKGSLPIPANVRPSYEVNPSPTVKLSPAATRPTNTPSSEPGARRSEDTPGVPASIPSSVTHSAPPLGTVFQSIRLPAPETERPSLGEPIHSP